MGKKNALQKMKACVDSQNTSSKKVDAGKPSFIFTLFLGHTLQKSGGRGIPEVEHNINKRKNVGRKKKKKKNERTKDPPLTSGGHFGNVEKQNKGR